MKSSKYATLSNFFTLYKEKNLLTYLFKTEIKSINKTSKFKVLALVCYNILSFNSSTKYK